MCLGIPGRVTSLLGGPMNMGVVDFDGVEREVCLACEPDVAVGDYVLVHVGFAISRIDEQEAQRTLAALRELGEVEAELGPGPGVGPEPGP